MPGTVLLAGPVAAPRRASAAASRALSRTTRRCWPIPSYCSSSRVTTCS